jgi:hypothetical protein
MVCALVDVKGNAFSIDIDESKLVDHLKKAIKIESSTDDVKKLKKGENTALIEALTHKDN